MLWMRGFNCRLIEMKFVLCKTEQHFFSLAGTYQLKWFHFRPNSLEQKYSLLWLWASVRCTLTGLEQISVSSSRKLQCLHFIGKQGKYLLPRNYKHFDGIVPFKLLLYLIICLVEWDEHGGNSNFELMKSQLKQNILSSVTERRLLRGTILLLTSSVTRLGNFLDLKQLF